MRKPSRKTVKSALNLLVGTCAGWTAQDVIKNNVNPETKAHKAQVLIGSAAIGAVVHETTGKYTDRLVDELADAFKAQKPSTPKN
jgi:hypothetical protein